MTPDGATPNSLPLSLSLDTVLMRSLATLAQDTAAPSALRAILEQTLSTPDPSDAQWIATARGLGLTPPEILVLHALVRCELDPAVAQAVGALQSGDVRFRPSTALLAQIAQCVDPNITVQRLFRSKIFTLPLALIQSGPAPAVLSPVALVPAMRAAHDLPEAARLERLPTQGDIPQSWRVEAAQVAARIKGGNVALILRDGLPADQYIFAAALAESLGRALVRLGPAQDRAGLGAALAFAQAVPLEAPVIPAGTRASLIDLAGYSGARMVLADGAGGVTVQGWDVLDVSVPPLLAQERAQMWSQRVTTPDTAFAALAGLGPSRLAAVAARVALDPTQAPDRAMMRAAAGAEARPDLEPHGQLVASHVDDDALVASETLKADLRLLAARCAARRANRGDLGPAFHARGQETGVRALLSGPSGGGKTMACAWVATQLGMPLFRVDLASVVSKYIGETEENLARILDRAEAADVVLLFDEADSLFGARTDVKDSSDRFANNQTNYLLSRIESYNGIVLMTTNSRDRIDTAFARRIDQIVEVPIPDARERRAIWRAHLGQANGLSGLELNALSSGADLSGGHIRSIVSTAAVLAQVRQPGRAMQITMAEISRALDLEYRKIGRTPPTALVRL